MTTIIFAGPSLAGTDAALPDGFVLLPPAGQGDVYLAAERRPKAIGIADGYFEGVPSVLHKEILWALSLGIAVYGSASIGALRAAELHACGMIGVGDIFAAYRDGDLEADDEVALLHGPPETGFVSLTEPLVNVRATCRAAEAAGVIERGAAEALLAVAKSTFYKERTWPEVIARSSAAGVPEDRIASFATWLAQGRVDQKRHDALQMIERMQADLNRPLVSQLGAAFEPTFLWERAVAGWARKSAVGQSGERLDEWVLNEIRLDPRRYQFLKVRAQHRMQALHEATSEAASVTRSERMAVLKRHRMQLGLSRGVDLDRWLRDQHLARPEYDGLIDEQTLAEQSASRERPDLHRHMIALLKLDSVFGPTAKRARAKAAALSDAEGDVERRRPPPPVLLDWFFMTRLDQVPDDLDHFIRNLGLASRESFYSLLADEYLYCASQDKIRAS